MKTLTESDLLKIVNKVLNEQEDKEFDEDEIDFLRWIFERELKPPFRKGERLNDYLYYNRDNKIVGMIPYSGYFLINDKVRNDIGYKVCQLFGYPYNTLEWLFAITPYLKPWMENQINVKLDTIW